jgi:hypothetical protein
MHIAKQSSALDDNRFKHRHTLPICRHWALWGSPSMPSLKKCTLAIGTCLLPLLSYAPSALSADTRNLTGLPAYPNLNAAVMDEVFRTDKLGHWCMRFWADTADSLATVEAWYRKKLLGSSEIDLTRDKTYKSFAGLTGVKIVLGIDYVVVYKTSSQAPTSIDLYRCSPVTN